MHKISIETGNFIEKVYNVSGFNIGVLPSIRNPLKFSNFSINGNKVYADIDFNDNGSKYHSDGILKGVSVEINQNDKLSKIAVLPIGINPAVSGAEFEKSNEGITLNFEEGEEDMGANEIIALLNALNVTEFSNADLESLNNAVNRLLDDKWRIKNLQDSGYTVQKEFSKEDIDNLAKNLGYQLVEFEKEKTKTMDEIRSEIKEELEFENKKSNLKNLMKTKIIPVLQPIFEYAIDKSVEERKNVIEFSENEKITMFEKIEKDISVLENPLFKKYFENIEFEKEEKGNSIVENSFNETKNYLEVNKWEHF